MTNKLDVDAAIVRSCLAVVAYRAAPEADERRKYRDMDEAFHNLALVAGRRLSKRVFRLFDTDASVARYVGREAL